MKTEALGAGQKAPAEPLETPPDAAAKAPAEADAKPPADAGAEAPPAAADGAAAAPAVSVTFKKSNKNRVTAAGQIDPGGFGGRGR